MKTGRRMVAIAAVSVVLGVVLGTLLLGATARRVTIQSLGPAAQRLYDTYELAHCEAAPAHWTVELGDDVRGFAYDSESLTSRNAEAPPIDRMLLEQLRAHPDQPWDTRGPLRGGTVLIRGGRPGACGLLQLRWVPPGLATTVTLELALLVILLAGGGSLLVGVLVVRPLVLRLEALRQLASQLGKESGLPVPASSGANEFDELTHALHDAHRRIRADTEGLQRHLADVAHDLRTPLASLQLTLEQALDEAKGPEQVAPLLTALNDVVYLGGLTQNLRLASQIEGGWNPVASAPFFDLREVVASVAGRARILARRRGIRFEVALPDGAVRVQCDRFAAEQAVGNLVDNAVAYGDHGGNVSVALDASRDKFTLAVIDDGPGLSSLELPLLGSRTFRADAARRRDPRGSGLGIAISHEVCRRSGWTLAFAHEAPHGLRASIDGSTVGENPLENGAPGIE